MFIMDGRDLDEFMGKMIFMDKDICKNIDKYDVALAVSSGTLTAALDIIWVNDISFVDAHTWGNGQVDNFVMKAAKSKGYNGNDIAGAIIKLEDDFPMDGDLLMNKFGGGLQHHLRDFSHHPTPVGLLFSLLMQFTGKGYGTDGTGKFVKYDIPEWQPKGFEDSIYLGTVSWLFHIVSDIAGTSRSRRMGKEGTGLPGPLMSFLKEISAIPGIRSIAGKNNAANTPNKESNYKFSVICSKLFNGTLLREHDENGKNVLHKKLRFDLRTELGIVHESIKNKQYIPVVLNDLIISSFYSVCRFAQQIQDNDVKSLEELNTIDIRECLPWKNEAIRQMRMIGAAAFSIIDLSAAGIKAALKNKDNPSGFALDFIQGINYWGLGNLALASNSEFLVKIQKMQVGFLAAAEKQKQAIIEKIPNGKAAWDLNKYTAETAVSIAKIGTPIGFIAAAVGVYDEIKKSLIDLKEATEERIRTEEICTARIETIQSNRAVMEEMVSDYLYSKITAFTDAFSAMDKAITESDIEAYITGSNMIQEELSGKIFVLNNGIDEFLTHFSKIKNVDFTESEGIMELNNLHIDQKEFDELSEMTKFSFSLVQGGVTGAAGGALAAFGAYSAATTFATASTGTVIASLSGAAASNATLAFFGGGSLAAGGLGMAGGTAILGGIVAGPALLVMGIITSAKAGKTLQEAYTNDAKANEICEELKTAAEQCIAIRRRGYMFYTLLAKLDAYLYPLNQEMKRIIENEGTDYSQFSPESKKTIAAVVSTVGSIKSVLDTTILTESGDLTEESEKIAVEMVGVK